jgi:hypothetical protein
MVVLAADNIVLYVTAALLCSLLVYGLWSKGVSKVHFVVATPRSN